MRHLLSKSPSILPLIQQLNCLPIPSPTLHRAHALCIHLLSKQHQLWCFRLYLGKPSILSSAYSHIACPLAHIYIVDGRILDWCLLLNVRHSECGVRAITNEGARKRVELLASLGSYSINKR
jgi:hypothetical protein